MDLPSDDALRWMVRHYARLRGRYGYVIGAPALLQPTAQFFPDEFAPDAPGVERLFRRMMGYSPVADDLGIELAFVMPEERGGGGCGSAACGPDGSRAARHSVEELDDGYRVWVAAADVAHADLLSTSLARAVGSLVLAEAGEAMEAGEEEIAAVACGFGVLLANGASVWAKSCGGLRMAQATTLAVEEIAVALALFVAVHEVRPSVARAHLGATQREALDVATAWVESNPLLVESLRDRPSSLTDGRFDLEPVRGLLGRWIHKRQLERELRALKAPPPTELQNVYPPPTTMARSPSGTPSTPRSNEPMRTTPPRPS
jgi:hypothetical protein